MLHARTYILLAAVFLFPACGPQYQKTQLKSLDNARIYQKTQNNITVAAHHMNRTDIQQTFGTRGRKLGYYGLCPIQLSIKNESNDSFCFDPTLTTIEYANHADVAACLQNRTVGTTTALVGVGLLATGIAFLHTLPFLAWYLVTGVATSFMYVGLGTTAGLLILTPTVSVYYAQEARVANQAISQDMKEIAATHTRTIPSGQELNVILFTKKENCKKDFSISLINEATQEKIVFNLTH